MSIIIKKRTGEIFDLPSDYIIESEKNNPLFTNKGSQSVSIDFPNTNNNRQLLEHANRIDKKNKLPAGIPVVVESGPVHQSGLMVINSASDKSTSANIGWDESEMYATMGTTQLKDLKNLPVFTAGGTDIDTRVDAMLTHLTAVMKEQIDADYYIFPVVLKEDFENFENQNGNKYPIYYYERLNDFVSFKLDANGLPVHSNGEMGDLLGINARIILRFIDSEVVLFDVPKGYGVSPFLKVWRILELIFESYGWILANNPFKEHRQLKRLVVLNNTIDAVISGRLNYKDMMPDITVKEFLDALYNKFGLQYFIDSNTQTVSLMFWKDILASPQFPADFTKFKTAPVTINYSQNKQLKLVANREIEGTEVPYNTFEDFLKAYDYQFFDVYGDVVYGDWYLYSSIFFGATRSYAIKDIYSGHKRISSDFFDWDKKADLPYEEIKMTDLCVPVKPTDKFLQLYYLAGYKHVYSDISISDEAVESSHDRAKLAFAFGWGKTNLQANLDDNQSHLRFNYFYASQDNRNEYGRFIHDLQGSRYDLSLTCHRKDGLFNRFWREYDAFLRHSAYRIDAKLKLPETEIIRLKMYQLISIDNQPLLPEQISFKQNKPDSVSECKFKTVRLYEPYDLNKEQAVEEYHPQNYYWMIEVEHSDPIEENLNNIFWFYTIEELPGVSGAERQPLLWLPPSEYEFTNNKTRTIVFNYVVCYTLGGVNYRVPVTKTLTLIPTLIS